MSEDIRKMIDKVKNFKQSLNEGELIKSDNFATWFGDSETTNNDGTPKIYYHGTDSNFKSFDSSFIGKTPYAHDDHGLGFFFSNNKSFVTQFGSNLMEVYLRIENPEYMDYDEYVKAISMGDSEYPTYNGDSLREFLIKDGIDGIIVTGWNPRTEIICVFEPNQIKSIHNDGSYDINDDDIYS
jgi:hypothetical protein